MPSTPLHSEIQYADAAIGGVRISAPEWVRRYSTPPGLNLVRTRG